MPSYSTTYLIKSKRGLPGCQMWGFSQDLIRWVSLILSKVLLFTASSHDTVLMTAMHMSAREMRSDSSWEWILIPPTRWEIDNKVWTVYMESKKEDWFCGIFYWNNSPILQRQSLNLEARPWNSLKRICVVNILPVASVICCCDSVVTINTLSWHPGTA